MLKTKLIYKAIGRIGLVLLLISLFSCNKFLDKKPVKSTVTPSTLADLQALLDDNIKMNAGISPGLLEIFSDDYYVAEYDWQMYDGNQGNYYWAPKAENDLSWANPYQSSIFNANTVLDALPAIGERENNEVRANHIRGAALFFRAFTFFQLAQAYCKPWSETAGQDLGIVLRLTSAIELPSTRSTLEETYKKIIEDLMTAYTILPEKSNYVFQPQKGAASGALARTYFYMRKYDSAFKYSNLTLQLHPDLLDYNILNTASNSPFLNVDNPELIFFARDMGDALTDQTVAIIDTNVYNSYAADDLRKAAFFRFRIGAWRFKGGYGGLVGLASQVFCGITTDEMYLMRSECLARAGDVTGAMEDLNAILRKRYVTGTYTDMTAINAEDAKNKILVERRKELLFRGLRFPDLRRLNMEGANITLTRILGTQTYTLPPGDHRWTALIPMAEIIQSGLQQNPR